ncbi:MAG: HEAT repeat domain-containing protein [Leptolyngbya sp.]|nr:HEAT repeat domain-containing protein [Candidatus Melainabacteria bacterium]
MSDLEKLAEIVDEMILQQDYPGFEPRSLKLGLPEIVENMNGRVFSHALGHESVYVRLVALRWFQERPGIAKAYLPAVIGLIDHKDEWVRLEAIRLSERIPRIPESAALKISKRLTDESKLVRKAASKALGKILKRSVTKDPSVVDALKAAAQDEDVEVRFKAQKALRNIGEFVV